MQHVVLVIHLILTVALIVVVLLQRSEGAGLSGPSASGMMPVRGTANLLTRLTAVLAGGFMLTSLTLAILAGARPEPMSLVETIAAEEQQSQSGGAIEDESDAVPVSGDDDSAGAVLGDVPVAGSEASGEGVTSEEGGRSDVDAGGAEADADSPGEQEEEIPVSR